MANTPKRFSRRTLLGTAGAGVAGVSMPALSFGAQAKAAAARTLTPLNRFPRMVQEYFVEEVRRVERKNLDSLAALKTKADAEAHVRLVREKIMRCFGPFPEKTPLNPRTTGVVDRDQ